MPYRLSTLVEQDLDEIWSYVAEDASPAIRLSSKDLEAIQKRALAEGLPYQTLIASLLHKYAAGRLKEI